ncbi:MAG: endonuclease [Planctomycetes bacterium]|nr:endonuclease [Planctomycetota bacterium]
MLRLPAPLWTAFVAILFASAALGQGPPGYYASVDATDGATLRATLHTVIDDHTRFPYTSGSTDTWDILELADEDPALSSSVLDVYRNASYAKEGGGNSFYNREHSWPKSYGFPTDGSTNYPYTDCHALFICDSGYNSSRSNKPFGICTSSCTEKPTDLNGSQGGGSGTYPGNSNWTSGSGATGTWEVWGGRRGDIARALFYMDVRYEGGTHGGTGVSEPDLILTDNVSLIASANTGSNETVGYMGMLTVLLQWHLDDPVDAAEQNRNEQVYAYQGNRNPFIDHPEWVACVFSGSCGSDTTPPAAPTGLSTLPGDSSVFIDWLDNAESDLAGYRIYRSETAGGPYSALQGGLVTPSFFLDSTVVNDSTYYYVVTAEDSSGNESSESSEVNATPTAGAGGVTVNQRAIFISEYVEGSSSNKAIEIYNATHETVDLADLELRKYVNGSASASSATLSGSLAPYGTAVFTNGSSGAANLLADLNSRGVPYTTLSLLTFNGNDALALCEVGGEILDVIGQVGQDPGTAWGSGATTTQNDTLRRRASVIFGDTDGGDAFDPADEFDGFPQDDFSGLGAHDGPLHVQVTCATTTHSGGVHATLSASGSASIGANDLSLTVASLPSTGTTAYLVNALLGPGQTLTTVSNPAPGGGPASSGDICIAGGTFGRHVFGSDVYIGTGGTFTISVDLADIPHPDGIGGYGVAAVTGETWYWQCWYRDQSAGVGASNFTEAIAITFQ